MIERAWAEAFAREWISDWNSHDVERVLTHYTDDFEMASPLIIELMNIRDGKLKGREAVRTYWSKGLAKAPQLHFELLDVMVGVNSVAIMFRSATASRVVIERIEFDEQQLGVRAEALYGPPPRA